MRTIRKYFLRRLPAEQITLPAGATILRQCPFLESMAHGFSVDRLEEFATGELHCHKTGTLDAEEGYVATLESVHCAGALIYLERDGRSHQMMRIAGRLGFYDPGMLHMDAPVRRARR
jgi:hypothetical protein